MVTDSLKPLAGISVLLVDDYPLNIRFAQGMLERLGATVSVAGNGREALNRLVAHHHIILMDIQMPVMDGYEAARHLRARGETRPIIALTAETVHETVEKIRAAGLTDVLVKPFGPSTLAGMILKYVAPLII